MDRQSANSTASIDGKTSRSICAAVGERLRQNLRPPSSTLPDPLRRLLEALQQQDAAARERLPN